MALQIDRELGTTGVIGNYHKIIGLNIITGAVTLAVYVDQAARDAGKQPIDSLRITIPPEKMNDTNTAMEANPDFPFAIADMDVSNPFVLAYDALKLLDKYSSAIDV